MAEFVNRPFSDFFPFVQERGHHTTNCQYCGAAPSRQYDRSSIVSFECHVEWHNKHDYEMWELRESISGLYQALNGHTSQAHTLKDLDRSIWDGLDEGDAVVDRHGRVWTLARDGGMVVRPSSQHKANVEVAGRDFVETHHGPLEIVYRKPRANPESEQCPMMLGLTRCQADLGHEGAHYARDGDQYTSENQTTQVSTFERPGGH